MPDHVPGRASSLAAALAAHGSPWLLVLLLTLQLASIWSVSFVPTQDGPVHLEMAAQLRALADGDSVLGKYYAINPRPEPNWVVYPLLSALARATSWRAAEKLAISAYLMALPLALAYALAAERADSLFLAVLAFPLAANHLFHMGSLNFSLSLPPALVTLGVGLRSRGPLRGRRLIAVTVLLLATSVAHGVSACAAATGLVVVAACRGLDAPGAATVTTRLRQTWRYAWPPLLASVPTLALVGVFLAGPSRPHPIVWASPLAALRRLLFLHVLVSYDRLELAPAIACSCLLACLAALRLAGRRRGARLRPGDELLAAAGALLLFYFALPDGFAGGGYLSPRLALWALLLGILWLAAEPWDWARRRTTTAAVAGLAGIFIVIHGLEYRRLSGYLEEFVSVRPEIDSDTAILSLSFVGDDWRLRDRALSGYKIHPFEHAIGYLGAERPLVDLTEYQADQGYFPVIYRESVNPYRVVVPEEGAVPAFLAAIDWRAYERRGGRVDYVLLWGRAASNPWPGEAAFLTRLEGDFESVFTSQRGLLELYRRRLQPQATTAAR